MAITLNDNAVNVFKLYDEMTIAYSKDIEGYKTLLKTIEALIVQKEEMLRNIKDKTAALVKKSLEIIPSRESSLHQNKNGEKFNYAGVQEDDLSPEKNIESGEAVVEITPPNKVQKTRPVNRRKATGKAKVERADKTKKPAALSKKTSETKPDKDIKCLYHPESPVLDIGRQLCSSCKWKLRLNGLLEYDKDPAVISFLKGETTEIPVLGQSMCPIHPAVPSYNKKTGLCQACQKKAKTIGVEDRHLTKKELSVLRNPSL
ncbi:MAG: hypothetical protein V1844_23965 [Pseudomonadota bacterium]